MRLPYGDRAVIDVAKLRDYSLSVTHPLGKQKARVFLSALGLTNADAGLLMEWLVQAAKASEVQLGIKDHFGQRYILDFPVTLKIRQATIRSAWIVRPEEDFPRLTTCYVL